ncbi:MAG: HAMP domain-containing histidine kinase [Candidatus Omnitrophica bacterium]|nr:HAMP domain-containing histidine kinase [Candidatus Omnitrophota bacterium]
MSPTAPPAPAVSKRTPRFWLGILLAFCTGVGLSLFAFFVRGGAESWAVFALGVASSSFLIAYLLVDFRKTAEVKKQVVQRTLELQEANRRLKELSRLKDEFIASVSHELRTPLTVIQEGVVQVLEGICGPASPAQRQSLSIAVRNIERLRRLIEDLLDISKIETGRMVLNLETFDLREVVREAGRSFLPRIQGKGLELKIHLPEGKVALYADRDRLAQVFSNLLDNALKFTRKGFIEICVLEESRRQIACRVSDTGLGLAPEFLSKLFHKFQQAPGEAANGVKGTGLGLAISKGIVELHDGRIWAESQPGQGTRFTFTLPVKTFPSQAHAA